ncbi:energy-coupling factor transporter ATP-binding protein EcfA2 [Chryseobacterium vietnamense]|uniref:ATP-binding protein n=2 Tax=Chryseobacterium TaxID=59732 RepID=UPI00285EFE01|nr:hypothetical protein [Chryseobacterium vietnamense]MDR6486857.1 energy-coupling factor transporter ATP-binding protein EcfA2 [Chryseobacterium vietnamense]
MTDFDFHNLLFPNEFEKLCRDIVDIRDSPIKFTTYRRGKDGGIDFKSTNTQIKIIGQCKLYNPSNYSSFLTSLKNEVQKCKRQNPDRYILCTNIRLSPQQSTEIYELFKGYIKEEEDIVDGEKLNKYLSNKKYQHLLKVYSKLLVPNLQFVERELEKIVNKKYINKTNSFLKEICKEHKLFHNTHILRHCIDVLEKNRVIILTGNPGVGKTTTAKMMVNYFINQKVENLLFLTDDDFVEIEGLYLENQIIVVDDFWGQNLSPVQRDGSLLRNFNRIINDFKGSENRYLILTSREYIIKDVLSHSEHETQYILNSDRFIVNLNDYSKEDKVRILLNHLLYYDFEKFFFSYLRYGDTLENIIRHPNYSPRHIEYYINFFLTSQDQNKLNFYHLFKKYIDSPIEYWNTNFKKLNGTSKLILLILLISSDPMDLYDLEKSFNAMQSYIRISLNENIEPLAFNKELKILEDFYIISEKQDYSSQILIRFQNPGIKDFLLEYLRTDGKLWIEPLIKNALFFNQLNHIFDIHDNDINDYSLATLYGKKIVLSGELQTLLKRKLISEFNILNFCFQGDRVFYDGEFSPINTAEESKYWKLFLFNNLFDISKDENLDVRNFIIEEVMKDINTYDKLDERKIVNKRAMSEFPRVVKLITPYVNFEVNYLIKTYLNSCTFTSEFDSFYEFKEIFPLEFDTFIKKNNTTIKKVIKYYIINDIDYYLDSDMGSELDTHLNYVIEEVCKKYKIRLTTKFINEIESMAGQRVLITSKPTKRKASPLQKKIKFKPKHKNKKFELIIDEYIPDDLYENFDPIQHMKKIKSSKKLIDNINKIIHLHGNQSIDPFKYNREIFSFFIHWIEQESISLLSYNEYTILDSFFTYYCKNKDINPVLFKSIFFELAENSFDSDFSITKTQIEKLFNKYNFPKNKIDALFPIIIADKKWYKFSSYDFQVYFISEHLNHIESEEEFKEMVSEYTYEIHDSQLLRYLSYKNINRLNKVVIIPELKRFLLNIDTTSSRTIFSSFLNFFKMEFEIEWYKQERRFGESSLSDDEWFISLIIQYLGIDFTTISLDVYFLKVFYSQENIKKYNINIKTHSKLYKYIINKLPKRNGFDLLTKESTIYFDINLYELVKDDEFYLILQEVGMENYVLNLYENIKQSLNNIIIG